MQSGNAVSEQVFLKHKAGHRLPVLTRIMPSLDSNGNVVGAIEIFTDNPTIVNSKQKIDDLVKLALIDETTGLRNRRSAEMNLKLVTQEARAGIPSGAFLISVNRYSDHKTNLGNIGINGLMKVICMTIKSSLSENQMLFRWSDNEFLVILKNIELSILRLFPIKLKSLINSSFYNFEEYEICPTVSIAVINITLEDTIEVIHERFNTLIKRCEKSGGNYVSVDTI
ncbi:diguanylate cyclase [bacterium]|nr:diguanylate cyclase [bacterium]